MESAEGRAASVGLLLVYGAVVLFFLYRFARHRRPPSVGVALLPGGWITLALWRLALITSAVLELIAWCGVVAGAVLLHLVVVAERVDPDGPPR